MDVLYAIHSFLRWPIMVLGIVGLIHAANAWSQGVGGGKLDRVLVSIFVGMLDLQLVFGLVFLIADAEARSSGLTHAGVMVVAVAVAHVLSIRSRRAEYHQRRRFILGAFLFPLLLMLPATTILV